MFRMKTVPHQQMTRPVGEGVRRSTVFIVRSMVPTFARGIPPCALTSILSMKRPEYNHVSAPRRKCRTARRVQRGRRGERGEEGERNGRSQDRDSFGKTTKANHESAHFVPRRGASLIRMLQHAGAHVALSLRAWTRLQRHSDKNKQHQLSQISTHLCEARGCFDCTSSPLYRFGRSQRDLEQEGVESNFASSTTTSRNSRLSYTTAATEPRL